MPRKSWKSVTIPEDLVRQIEKIHSEMGYASTSAFISDAVRRLLNEYKPRFEHYNTYIDHATIKDNQLGKSIDVYFRENAAWCELDDSTHCIHVQYALGLPQVKEAYQKKGLKNPEIT